jgi:hypothetical protein
METKGRKQVVILPVSPPRRLVIRLVSGAAARAPRGNRPRRVSLTRRCARTVRSQPAGDERHADESRTDGAQGVCSCQHPSVSLCRLAERERRTFVRIGCARQRGRPYRYTRRSRQRLRRRYYRLCEFMARKSWMLRQCEASYMLSFVRHVVRAHDGPAPMIVKNPAAMAISTVWSQAPCTITPRCPGKEMRHFRGSMLMAYAVTGGWRVGAS